MLASAMIRSRCLPAQAGVEADGVACIAVHPTVFLAQAGVEGVRGAPGRPRRLPARRPGGRARTPSAVAAATSSPRRRGSRGPTPSAVAVPSSSRAGGVESRATRARAASRLRGRGQSRGPGRAPACVFPAQVGVRQLSWTLSGSDAASSPRRRGSRPGRDPHRTPGAVFPAQAGSKSLIGRRPRMRIFSAQAGRRLKTVH